MSNNHEIEILLSEELDRSAQLRGRVAQEYQDLVVLLDKLKKTNEAVASQTQDQTEGEQENMEEEENANLNDQQSQQHLEQAPAVSTQSSQRPQQKKVFYFDTFDIDSSVVTSAEYPSTAQLFQLFSENMESESVL